MTTENNTRWLNINNRLIGWDGGGVIMQTGRAAWLWDTGPLRRQSYTPRNGDYTPNLGGNWSKGGDWRRHNG